MKKNPFEGSVFKNPEDYYNFAVKHSVFGSEAVKLKEKMLKVQKEIIGKPPKKIVLEAYNK